jgi:glucosamine-6-phosphate deaminase
MRLIVTDDAQSAAQTVADRIEATVRDKPRAVLGLACGRSSAAAYRELVRRHHACLDFSFRYATTFNLDEFVGVPPEDLRSSRYFMNQHLFGLIDIARENTHVMRGDCVDPLLETQAYDALITARGGLDLTILGLGYNGHIGFNEPGATAKSRTRVSDVTPSTVAALSGGSRFASIDEVPTQALTIGMAQILASRAALMIVTGIGKADVVHRLLTTRRSSQFPGTFLRDHADFTLVVDADAATKLTDEIRRDFAA